MTIRKYLGRAILPCTYVDNRNKGLRWYVETPHIPTGIPYGEQDSPMFHNLPAAREHIRTSLSR